MANNDEASVDPLDRHVDAEPAAIDCSAQTEEERAAFAVQQRQWDVAVEMGSIAVEPLILALQSDKNERMRKEAANALGQIGDPRAVDALIEAFRPFETPDGGCQVIPGIVQNAVWALGQIGDPRAVGPLAHVARNGQDTILGWSVGQAVVAIREILAAHLSEVSEDALRDVASLDDVFKQPLYFDGYGGPEMKELRNYIDCSDIQEIARRELAGRETR